MISWRTCCEKTKLTERVYLGILVIRWRISPIHFNYNILELTMVWYNTSQVVRGLINSCWLILKMPTEVHFFGRQNSKSSMLNSSSPFCANKLSLLRKHNKLAWEGPKIYLPVGQTHWSFLSHKAPGEAVAWGLGLGRVFVLRLCACLVNWDQTFLTHRGGEIYPSKLQSLAGTFSYKVDWPASNRG